MSMSIELYTPSQFNDPGAQLRIKLLVDTAVISDPNSVELLVVAMDDRKFELDSFIVCTDTEIIAKEFFVFSENIIKKYPYNSITGASKSKGGLLQKIAVHPIGRPPERLEVKMPPQYVKPLVDFINSKVSQISI